MFRTSVGEPAGVVRRLHALDHDPESRRAMSETKGQERAKQLVAGMQREREAQLDPNIRAERLVARWNGLEQEHAELRGWEHTEARQKIEQGMRAVAGEIGRDAQVESVLRQNREALGISERSNLGRERPATPLRATTVAAGPPGPIRRWRVSAGQPRGQVVARRNRSDLRQLSPLSMSRVCLECFEFRLDWRSKLFRKTLLT